MNEDEIEERLSRFRAEQSNRGFGDIPMRATAALAPFSRAEMEAATNLLDKALRALDGGDVERARRFVDRAVALPWDEHEQVRPAAVMAHQQMFDIVTDLLEAADDVWLSPVTDVLISGPDHARFCIRDVLRAVLQDYELSDLDQRRVRHLIAKVPERAELAELDLPAEELAAAVLEVLDGVVHFVDHYDEILEMTYGEE